MHSDKPLLEFAASKTHREYRTWMRYLEEEWNQPSRSDHYLMRIALEAHYAFRTYPQSVDLDKFKIPFKTPKSEVKKTSLEVMTAWAKARWCALTRLTKPKPRRGKS